MNPLREYELVETRRHFFSRSATGIGTAALASLMNPNLFAEQQTEKPTFTDYSPPALVRDVQVLDQTFLI